MSILTTHRIIAAFLLALATVFLATCLLSFDEADPPSIDYYPINKTVRNLCGPAGAWLAYGVVDVFGAACWLLIPTGIGLAVGILNQRARRLWVPRLIGYIVMIVASAGVLHLMTPARLGMAESMYTRATCGPAGMVGLALAGLMRDHLSEFGSLVILCPLAVGAMLLSQDPIVISIWFVIKQSALAVGTAFSSMWNAARERRKIKQAEKAAAQTQPASKPEQPTSKRKRPARDPIPVIKPKLEPVVTNVSFQLPEKPSADDEDEEIEESEELEEEIEETPEPVRHTSPLKVVRNERKERAKAGISFVSPSHSNVMLPDTDMLDPVDDEDVGESDEELRSRGQILEEAFATYGMEVRVVQIHPGPVVTQYEIELSKGLRANKVLGLERELAMAMRARTVRIIAPLPGKNAIGVEVPNIKRAKVVMADMMRTAPPESGAMRLPMFLGKDVNGIPLVCDLATMPHLLIAGRTGTGKSVCLNSLIVSMLMTRTPDQVKMLLIDPKMVEMAMYANIPHLLMPVVTDVQKAEALLEWTVNKMQQRYDLLRCVGVRNIDGYNRLGREEIQSRLKAHAESAQADGQEPTEHKEIPEHMPYIVLIVDEMADLIMTTSKEVEKYIALLAAKSRAIGIHLVLATQKPIVEVVTSLIKSNLPARICFQVASRNDSRVVLDDNGAEQLLGYGDMLFLYPGTSKLIRAQGTFVSDDEVTRVTEYLADQAKPQFEEELINLKPKTSSAESEDDGESNARKADPIYEKAVGVVISEQRGSVSLLQRALGIGYGKAARYIDWMEKDGIVGPYNGAKFREVISTMADWEEIRRNRAG